MVMTITVKAITVEARAVMTITVEEITVVAIAIFDSSGKGDEIVSRLLQP